MEQTALKILSTRLLEEYCSKITHEHLQGYEQLEDSALSAGTFSFCTSSAAVFSSRLEGENIDLDAYVSHKRDGHQFLLDYVRKVDDIYNAYQFTRTVSCNENNLALVHQILTMNILPYHRRGKIRSVSSDFYSPREEITYSAAPSFIVKDELWKFYHDLKYLTTKQLTIQETFFFASMLHLVFVKIYPFDDANGRISRLIEKWFLSEKIGEKAWLIESEKNYYFNTESYYTNIGLLGSDYDTLDYSKALPFLLMLPQSLIGQK
ncbi:hypothetical protein DYBT9275_00361 [Dyadobacter sp. CECT 9275]|uniref:Fido domain-containing protein n=1 Tax=Dyadobacter helix TaxID=2822344 RepID=A0A916JBG4_9BACT|nr:Fic family protein [Dyadobacter sp. CECT 9275]CAG4989735.1 hypothetical protein DYBT9275_00361 [Dyadobacter sp. CECT 9275]